MEDLLAFFVLSFLAGAVAFVNPCGIALLPAYVSFYLGSGAGGGFVRRLGLRVLTKALVLGLLSTIGFMAVFGAAGLVMGVVGAWIVKYVPWVSAIVGFGIALLGLYLLTGGKLPGASTLPGFDLSMLVRGSSITYFPLFGIAYAIVSMSCTIPVFLYIALQALSLGGVVEALSVFLSYAVGMGASMTAFTLALVLASSVLQRLIHRILPYTMRAAGAVMVAAGTYIIYWQVFKGGLLG
ncbi:MAG: hypothetical protein F7B17_07780 [Desulfurococcales archaeon]|nr:hypothetical protein [Desulfurococcales archaeon]